MPCRKVQAFTPVLPPQTRPQLRRAKGQPPIRGRGVRILCMDGGGMKGLVMVAMLKELEARAGRPIAELFDLIAGTSTGGMLGVEVRTALL